MHPDVIERAARLIAEARLARVPLGPLPEDLRPRDETEAYAVQDALHERLAAAGMGALGGHKIGCTTAVMQRYLGIDNPCAGGVFARTTHRQRADLRREAFSRIGLECEIAVRLERDLPGAAAPYDRQRAAGAVGACMAAIELVDDRYRDYRTLDTPTLIADDFFNAGCVLGPEVDDWRSLDLAALKGRMWLDGKEAGHGRGGDILGHPLEALAWLANLRVRQGRPLQAGAFVLLGSVVQTVWPQAGAHVEVEIEHLGRASCIIKEA